MTLKFCRITMLILDEMIEMDILINTAFTVSEANKMNVKKYTRRRLRGFITSV